MHQYNRRRSHQSNHGTLTELFFDYENADWEGCLHHVFRQLGINPLIKLGKEYLVGNNVALLEDDSYKNDENLSKNDRKLKKKSSKTNKKNQDNNFKAEVHLEANDKNQETSFIEENKVNEITDEVDNSRRKRRRSSASSE